MGYMLADKIKNLTPYEPLCGEYRIRLDANESFFQLPSDLLAEIQRAVTGEVEFNRYPDPYCVELCKRFAELYEISPDFVTAGNGSDELIGLIVGCFLQKGQKLITFAPDFSMYRFYGDIFETQNVILPKKDDLTIDIDGAICAGNEPDAGAIILSNPCNPTGLLTSRADLIRLIENTACLVVIDEAYMEFSDGSVMDLLETYDNLLVLKTCSKAIGLAAVRLGFAVTNAVKTRALRAVKSPYNVNSVTQKIGEIVLSHPKYLQNCTEQIVRARDELHSKLTKLSQRKNGLLTIYPTQTNFVFVRMGSTDAAAEVQQKLAERGIAVRVMGEFLRITAGSMTENEVLLESLSDIL